MGGENCSVYGCPCSRSRCPGLSFFTINTCGGKTTNPEILEWRRKLVAACQRMPPFNEKTAHICSRHFAPECMEEKGMCHFTIMNQTFFSTIRMQMYMYVVNRSVLLLHVLLALMPGPVYWYSLLMNSIKLVIPLHSLYWSIHTKDESKHRTALLSSLV